MKEILLNTNTILFIFLLHLGIAGCSTNIDVSDNTNLDNSINKQSVRLLVQKVYYDGYRKQWIAMARLDNLSEQPLVIAIDGDTSKLPTVHIPPAYLTIEMFQNGHWMDITPMSDGLAVRYAIEPNQHVLFDAVLPRVIEENVKLRIVFENVHSQPFSIGYKSNPQPN